MTEQNEAATVESVDSPTAENVADKIYDAPTSKAPVEKPEVAAEAAAAAEKKEAADESGSDSKADDKEKVGAPDEYEDFTLAEGLEADAEFLGQFKETAKELNLSQEHAQKIVDLYNSKVEGLYASQRDQWDTVLSDWSKATKSDKEVGGEKFDENLAFARKALDKYGTPELREALDLTGVGNHVEFVRAWSKVGKDISEDTVVAGSNPRGNPDRIRNFYDNSQMN